ncbi:unnamed protein product [Musa acuminata subsp. burmannicoides]
MMPWTWRNCSTWQGMVMAPVWWNPYSSSAARSRATKSGWLRYPTGTTNRCCSSPAPPTRIAIHPLGGAGPRLPPPPVIPRGDKCRYTPGISISHSSPRATERSKAIEIKARRKKGSGTR